MTFAVYELYPDGTEFNTQRTFTTHGAEDNNYSMIVTMFNKLYQFTIGPNGFQIVWDKDDNGDPLTFQSGSLYWGGPRPPAAPIGGSWWRIKRVT